MLQKDNNSIDSVSTPTTELSLLNEINSLSSFQSEDENSNLDDFGLNTPNSINSQQNQSIQQSLDFGTSLNENEDEIVDLIDEEIIEL